MFAFSPRPTEKFDGLISLKFCKLSSDFRITNQRLPMQITNLMYIFDSAQHLLVTGFIKGNHRQRFLAFDFLWDFDRIYTKNPGTNLGHHYRCPQWKYLMSARLFQLLYWFSYQGYHWSDYKTYLGPSWLRSENQGIPVPYQTHSNKIKPRTRSRTKKSTKIIQIAL